MISRRLSLCIAFVAALGCTSARAAVIPSPANDILLSSKGGIADINGVTTDGSENYSGLPPANLNDGERDGFYNNGLGVDGQGSIAHTSGGGTGNEMGVKIPSAVFIGSVDLFNRTDCCNDRIDGGGTVPFTLNVFNGATLAFTNTYDFTPTISLTGVNPNNSNTETASDMVIPIGVVGTYVQIVQNNSNLMNLAEIEAFSTPEPSSLAALLGMGAVGLFAMARRRRRSA